MGKVVADLSMSLDGFINGPNDRIELPLGEGGGRLYDWIFGGKSDQSGSSPRTSATDSNHEEMDEAYETMGRASLAAGLVAALTAASLSYSHVPA